MSSIKKALVVGAGGWGTAVANLLANANLSTTLWGRDPAVVDAVNQSHENPKYLPGIRLSPKLRATGDLLKNIPSADLVVCSIPTQKIREVFLPLATLIEGKTLLNTSKGMEQGTYLNVSDIFSEIIPACAYATLSGPNFAKEVAMKLPAATTIASTDTALSESLQTILSCEYFRVYTSTDVRGVELGGALKNVIAIAAGITDGLKLGYNAQAALINRGIAEMVRIGQKLGAQVLTFFGLAGMGDLILTCTGPLSRNRNLGIALGQGKSLADAIRSLGGVAEGYYTAQSVTECIRQLKLEAPIMEQVYDVLYKGKSPKLAVNELMTRELGMEWPIS